jgi:hypothetical protein
MRRTYAYFTSLLLILIMSMGQVHAQDTIMIPLKIKVGLEVSGPITYSIEKTNLKAEGYISMDLDEKRSLVFGAGYLNYQHSQYNYDYLNTGVFIRTGIDFNLLKPEKSLGKYWAGIGLRYGLSRFTSEVPSFTQENYWGKTTSSIAKKTNWGHFFEVSPGVRAEVFNNLSIGWTISLRMLLYTGTGKELKPIYFPGFGYGGKRISTGLNYFISYNIPYKKIRVISKKEEPEETEDTEVPANGQKPPAIR